MKSFPSNTVFSGQCIRPNPSERRGFVNRAMLAMVAGFMLSFAGMSPALSQSSPSSSKVTITEFSVETLTSDAERQAAANATIDESNGRVGGQVDLLPDIADNTTNAATSASVDSVIAADSGLTGSATENGQGRVSSIDEAVSLITVDTSQTQENDTLQAAPLAQDDGVANAENNTSENQTVSTGVNAGQADDQLIDAVTDTATDMAADGATVDAGDAGDDTNGDAARVSLVRTSVSYNGVADVGVEPLADSRLTRVVWRGTTADTVLSLANADFANGGSSALAALAGDVVALRVAPPAEIEGRDTALVAARLDWLAAAGRSQDIGVIVDGLPNDPEWLDWKKWQVVTLLSEMRDADACRSVMYYAGQTLEPFWHRAKVICDAVQDNAAGARFAADLLQAMGQDDPVFRALVGRLLDGTEVPDIDPALLEPIHIVLMEAAHHPIDIDGLDALPAASLQSAAGLRYLNDEARLVRAYRALQKGFLSHQDVAKQWRLADVDSGDMAMALSRHESMPTALTRALLWRSLDVEKTANRLVMIAAAMDVDVAGGAGLLMAPLYADLAREALGFEGAAALLSGDGAALSAKISLLLAAAGNMSVPGSLDAGAVDALAGIESMLAGGALNEGALDYLDMWHLLPLFERRVSGSPATTMPVNWLAFDSAAARAPRSFVSVAPVWMRALEQAAGNSRVGEAVLIAQRIVASQGLEQLHPADVARIHDALIAIGQGPVANSLATDVVSAHLLETALRIDVSDLPPMVIDQTASADDTGDAGDTNDTGNASDAGEGDSNDDSVIENTETSGTATGSQAGDG